MGRGSRDYFALLLGSSAAVTVTHPSSRCGPRFVARSGLPAFDSSFEKVLVARVEFVDVLAQINSKWGFLGTTVKPTGWVM